MVLHCSTILISFTLPLKVKSISLGSPLTKFKHSGSTAKLLSSDTSVHTSFTTHTLWLVSLLGNGVD